MKEIGEMEETSREENGERSPPSLPGLLSALALGARSVNSLPLGKPESKNENSDDESEDDNDDDDDLDDDDEFAYQMAFPEFSSLCLDSRSKLASMLNQALQSTATATANVNINTSTDADAAMVEDYEFDDPRLWESAAEACDLLLERVDVYIQNVKEGRAGLGLDDEQIHEAIGRIGNVARNKAKGGFDQMMGSLVEMEKPQMTYNFVNMVQNSRTDPFIPMIHNDRPFSINQGLQIKTVPGHGLESKMYGGASAEYLKSIPGDIEAPLEYYPHPYKEEIDALKYRQYQLDVEGCGNGNGNGKGSGIGIHGTSGTLNNPVLSANKGIWIDKEEDLIKLVNRINDSDEDTKEIAIDLEAHSFRSFSGFLCLMQLSLRRPTVTDGTLAKLSDGEDSIETAYDFVIDTLALHHVMNEYFAPIMANPDIVKVMHGADSDVQWLQRDFGIYIVNLFDTGRACRALPHFSKAALAYLLSKYANVDADKQHQLSDWRQRPLPVDMRSYAVSDTMYLLDIYDKIRLELIKYSTDINDISVENVLDASKNVCLIRFDKEPFRPSSYTKLITSKRGKKMNTALTDGQDAVLKALYDWRDNIAREEDESLQYVCGNTGLVRIATTCPQTVGALQACVNPLPPLVLKYANEILRIMRVNNFEDKTKFSAAEKKTDRIRSMASPSAFFHKSSGDASSSARSGMMSPVLGTDDLYKQAGWTSPSIEGEITSSSDADAQDLSTHDANRDFSSAKFGSHSLEMNPNGDCHEGGRSKSVDGMGAARATMGQELDEISKQKKIAHKCANHIRETMASGNQNLLGIVKPSKYIQEEDNGSNNAEQMADVESKDAEVDSDEAFVIPKSMKEIYRMSNKNRRKTKKTPVYFSDDEDDDTKDAMGIQEAEDLIAESGPGGKDYFDISSSKRQRTDSTSLGKDQDAKDGDIELMADLGWVKDKTEAEGMLSEQRQSLDTGGDVNENKEGRSRGAAGGESNNAGGKQQGKTRREKRISKQANIPYDYSKVGAIGVGGPSTSDNPFFAGAAIASQSQKNTGKERKRSTLNRKGGKKNNSYAGGGGDGNKSYAYRGGK